MRLAGGAKSDCRPKKSLWWLNEPLDLRKDESGGVFAQAASAGNFQNFQRPELRREIVGRYRVVPGSTRKALVLCCDEKSQCQALERTQRGLPLKKGYSRTQTHDYIRQGTITLFAALSYLEGKIISRTEESHT